MQSSPNGTVKKLKSLDQGSNDINYLLNFLNDRKFSKIILKFWCLLAILHHFFYKLHLHAYSITHFIFLCEP